MSKKAGSPKTGGRKKGTPNKRTSDLYEALQEHDFNVPERIIELIPSLSEDRQVSALLQLMPYLYPKRRAVEHTVIDNGGSGGGVMIMLPSNGREHKGTTLYSEDESGKISVAGAAPGVKGYK